MSKKQASARKRRKPRPRGPRGNGWLIAAVLMSIIVGFALSPLTGLRSVSVAGGDPAQFKIRAALEPYKQVSWLRQNRGQMVDSILADFRLDRASIHTNIAGQAWVKIEPRRPVAAIPEEGLLLSSTGVLYADEVEEKLPILRLTSASPSIQLTLVGSLPLKSLARVAAEGSNFYGELPFSLVLDGRSVISLQVTEGPEIVLGTDAQLDQKFEVLERARANDPEQFKRAKVINVSAPDRPVISSS